MGLFIDCWVIGLILKKNRYGISLLDLPTQNETIKKSGEFYKQLKAMKWFWIRIKIY